MGVAKAALEAAVRYLAADVEDGIVGECSKRWSNQDALGGSGVAACVRCSQRLNRSHRCVGM